MTEKNVQQILHIEECFNNFNSEKSKSVQIFLKQIKCQSEEQKQKMNQILQRQIKKCLSELMNKGQTKLFSELLNAVCQSLSNQTIKKSIAIAMVEDILQCLGVNDLKSILNLISERVCSFQNLQIIDQNRLLRVINHLLKRISKTEDYLTRGQLQFTLTKILPFCHDSGFHYRNLSAKAVSILESQSNQQYNVFNTQGITYQFYKDFWELQTYFMDPNQLINDNKSITNKNEMQQHRNKAGVSINSTNQPVLACKLKKIQKVLSQTINYFNTHPVSQLCKILQQPIKFLTNTNLLQLQLNDSYFRKIIVIQVLIFTFSLTYLKPTGNILKGTIFGQQEKKLISNLQKIAWNYLENISNKNNKIASQNKQQTQQFIRLIKIFFDNQIQWTNLKDHWKQKKKNFFKSQMPIENLNQEEKKQKIKAVLNIQKKKVETAQKINEKMGIDGNNLKKFISLNCQPALKTTSTSLSFSYYWSQAKTCLESFNFDQNKQTQFQTRSQYNLYQWKSLRSLYRQNLKALSFGNKQQKLRDYRMLSYVNKKLQERKEKSNQIKGQNNQEIGDELKKKVKLN